ncbi:ATP synthase subunit I [Beduinella massiliensis]|uniref:ATP synthase subunit I n=1 Tax=Beduinella massiliensis TaxID=1852363 RepID=UPI0031F7D51C
MKPQQAVVQETKHIALGTAVLCAIMLLIFLILGKFHWTVLTGALLGFTVAVGNFFALGLSVQKAAAKPDKAKQIMQLSYSMRMLVMALCVILAMATPAFHWVAAVLPLIFPRVTIGIMQIMGKYKPARKEAE